ncbi:uncharacterized protein EI90DRAFT_3049023 [Cantharellus anzutake]|uniref:uncharacterized protein n=1 Tax=Cantharellus anzutake TaxID=1750568 RepID=UPI001907F6D1|nr:uncharacterized protein EI90DRAFT_3049023 [Cantharellus anzutake]KAF8334950.1 hypothetical protein EI90DRAFT_3049023 [Cantharellus anzutake]
MRHCSEYRSSILETLFLDQAVQWIIEGLPCRQHVLHVKLVSVLFQFVRFLLTFLLHTTRAANVWQSSCTTPVPHGFSMRNPALSSACWLDNDTTTGTTWWVSSGSETASNSVRRIASPHLLHWDISFPSLHSPDFSRLDNASEAMKPTCATFSSVGDPRTRVWNRCL